MAERAVSEGDGEAGHDPRRYVAQPPDVSRRTGRRPVFRPPEGGVGEAPSLERSGGCDRTHRPTHLLHGVHLARPGNYNASRLGVDSSSNAFGALGRTGRTNIEIATDSYNEETAGAKGGHRVPRARDRAGGEAAARPPASHRRTRALTSPTGQPRRISAGPRDASPCRDGPQQAQQACGSLTAGASSVTTYHSQRSPWGSCDQTLF